jgi:beta-glucanase (GH16 family)
VIFSLKTPLLGLVGYLLSVSAFAYAQTPEPWRLVWSDEFDGKSLDFSKWEIEVNAFGGGNQELQIYTDRSENVRVANGFLIIEAHRQRTGIAGTERDFSSGRIRSKRRGDWKYGRFEARMKLPAGQGLWPAFWMLPSDEKYGTWAASGEVDIMEFKGQQVDTLWGTLHHGGSWPRNKHTGLTKRFEGIDFTKDFHIFGVEWSPTNSGGCWMAKFGKCKGNGARKMASILSPLINRFTYSSIWQWVVSLLDLLKTKRNFRPRCSSTG